MVPPLVAGLIVGSALTGAGANLYSQHKQRELYRYQKQGYERAYRQWQHYVPNRRIANPELSYPGHIRALDTGISQSYASSLGSLSSMAGFAGGGLAYRGRSARSLYGGRSGRSSRYL